MTTRSEAVHEGRDAAERLIVALDVDTCDEAMRLVTRLEGLVSFFKVGWQLFMGTHFQVPHALAERGKRVFLDLKMGDIPATIVQALDNMPRGMPESLEMMTFQGASSLMESIRRARGAGKPRLLMLTVLSSLGDRDVQELYGERATMDELVALRVRRALDAGCDGVIASGDSVGKLRAALGSEALIVTPGIRPRRGLADDQRRLLTPFQAARDGADYLVVGRPIRNAADPRAAAQAVIEEVRAGRAERERTTSRPPRGESSR